MSPRRVDAERRRRRILAVALRIFALRGYGEATLKEIATAAGLGSAAHLYYYFPKKEELFGATLVRYLRLEPMLEPDELDEPLDVVLDRYAHRYLEQLGDPEVQLAFLLFGRESGRLLTMGLDLSAVDLALPHRELEAYLRRQQELGRLRDDVNPDQSARAVIGILNLHIQSRNVPLVRAVSRDEKVARYTVDIVLNGIAKNRL
jgi:AcrR family transcriptional regulator